MVQLPKTFGNKHVIETILLCNLISQHAIFHEVRSMLTCDSLFRFPVVHEVILYGLFENGFACILV